MAASLRGKVAIVLGAGSDLGRATALLLAQSGASVFCADASAPLALRTARLVDAESSPFGHARVDPTRLLDLRRMFTECRRALGQADALVNCVEAVSRRPWPEGLSDADFGQVLNANLRSVVFATQFAVQDMAERGGAVVNVSSYEATHGMRHDPVYAASKAGVEAFTRSLAQLHAECRVRVMCVSSGPLDAPRSESAPPAWRAYLKSSSCVQPSTVAYAVCQLVATGKGGTVKVLPARG